LISVPGLKNGSTSEFILVIRKSLPSGSKLRKKGRKKGQQKKQASGNAIAG
jgi:hypothetical protein